MLFQADIEVEDDLAETGRLDQSRCEFPSNRAPTRMENATVQAWLTGPAAEVTEHYGKNKDDPLRSHVLSASEVSLFQCNALS